MMSDSFADMSHPFKGITRQEVQGWITRHVHSLERATSRRHFFGLFKRRAPEALLPFLRELQSLAAEDRLDVARIRDWKERFQHHSTRSGLKGMEATAIIADELEYLANHENIG
jgi:hypothetical protein